MSLTEVISKSSLQVVVTFIIVVAMLIYGGIMLYNAKYNLTIDNNMFREFYVLFSNIVMLALGKWLFGRTGETGTGAGTSERRQ